MRISIETLGLLSDLGDESAKTMLTWYNKGDIPRTHLGTSGGSLTYKVRSKSRKKGVVSNTFYLD